MEEKNFVYVLPQNAGSIGLKQTNVSFTKDLTVVTMLVDTDEMSE